MWAAITRPGIEYIEIPSEPQAIMVEKEVQVGERPYYSEIATKLTEEEIDLLAKLAYEEAGNQSFLGQRAVVEVVLNRIVSDRFPDTIQEVIYQDNPVQFTPAYRLGNTEPTEEQYRAVSAVLSSVEPLLDSDVLYFGTDLNGRTL